MPPPTVGLNEVGPLRRPLPGRLESHDADPGLDRRDRPRETRWDRTRERLCRRRPRGSIVDREAGLHGMAIDAGRGRGRCRGLAAGIGISLRTREAERTIGPAPWWVLVVGMVAALLAGLIPSYPIGSFLVLAIGLLVDGLGASLACAGIGRPASRH